MEVENLEDRNISVTMEIPALSPSVQIYINDANVTYKNFTNIPYEDEYIFDRTDVRIIFITLYSMVFSCCFFGNLLVILVVALSRRLRSITNFFLANLAVADFCVGIFCVYQNLLMYLIPSWVLGDFFCKMYQFVHSLSYTASIFILVVICTERYFAIIHPVTCKQILTSARLRLVILIVWIMSAAYSAPRFLWVQTIVNHMPDGTTEIICATHRKKYNSQVFDIINFVFLYVVPLIVMTVLYTRIAVGLWQSASELEKHLNASTSTFRQQPKDAHQNVHHTCEHACQELTLLTSHVNRQKQHSQNKKLTLECKSKLVTGGAMTLHHSNSTQNVLRARRGVIRMLIVMVLTFAICNLPFHARKMWQYWSTGYQGSSIFSTLFTPLTFLITYFNSGVNPLLYAFLSRNFRRGMKEICFFPIRYSPARRITGHKLYDPSAQANDNIFRRQVSFRSNLKANCTSITILNVPLSDEYSNEV